MEIRLSYSAVSAYERCPLSYRYQYVAGLEVEPSPHLSFGRSLHAALQWLYARDVPVAPSLDELLSHLEACWDGEGFEDPEEELSFLRHARDVLSDYYRLNVRDFRLPVAVEQRFEIPMEGYLLTGVVDRVDRHPDGSYEIIDYKTNRRLPELARLRDDLQLPIYQMASRELWGISPSKLTFYYLLINQKYSTRPLDDAGLERVRNRLRQVAEGISSGRFPANPNRLCPWCSFRDVCPTRVPADDIPQGLRARRAALLRRKERLEALIAELEAELEDLGGCNGGGAREEP